MLADKDSLFTPWTLPFPSFYIVFSPRHLSEYTAFSKVYDLFDALFFFFECTGGAPPPPFLRRKAPNFEEVEARCLGPPPRSSNGVRFFGNLTPPVKRPLGPRWDSWYKLQFARRAGFFVAFLPIFSPDSWGSGS